VELRLAPYLSRAASSRSTSWWARFSLRSALTLRSSKSSATSLAGLVWLVHAHLYYRRHLAKSTPKVTISGETPSDRREEGLRQTGSKRLQERRPQALDSVGGKWYTISMSCARFAQKLTCYIRALSGGVQRSARVSAAETLAMRGVKPAIARNVGNPGEGTTGA